MLPNGRSPRYSLPSASDTASREVPGATTSTRSQRKPASRRRSTSPPSLDPDRAGQLQREQVVDRDAVLVAGREDDDREHAEGEREQRADGDQRPCHGGRLAPPRITGLDEPSARAPAAERLLPGPGGAGAGPLARARHLQGVAAQPRGAPPFVFYEGPPTANGYPGAHHVLARVFKDVFPRYKTMTGHYVERKGGWDCHGLPVEIAVEQKLGFTSKDDIERYGIAEFNRAVPRGGARAPRGLAGADRADRATGSTSTTPTTRSTRATSSRSGGR